MMARIFLALALWFTATAAHADNITLYSAGSVAIGESRQLTAYVLSTAERFQASVAE